MLYILEPYMPEDIIAQSNNDFSVIPITLYRDYGRLHKACNGFLVFMVERKNIVILNKAHSACSRDVG